MQIMAVCLRSWREVGPVSSMSLLVRQMSMLVIAHLMLTVALPMVRRDMSSNLTSMVRWLSHTSTWLLVMSNSIHSIQPLGMSLLILLLSCNSLLKLPLLLFFNSCLPSCLLILSLLLFALVEHISNFSKVINLCISCIELVILVSTLNDFVSTLLFS